MIKKKNDTNHQDEMKNIFSISVQGIESMARKGIEWVWGLNRESGNQTLSTFYECV
jgi:hypothetical protein